MRSFKDEAMKKIRIGVAVVLFCVAVGCSMLAATKPYGEEDQLFLPGTHRQVWAIAPALNLSGEDSMDPLLQSDLVYQELQKVHGLTVIPVDRVVEVYAAMRIGKVHSAREAQDVCRLLGCDGLVVPTVTAYDPYDPPKFGASIQLFVTPGSFQRLPKLDPRVLEQSPTAVTLPVMPDANGNMAQVVEMYDASDGTVREAVKEYAKGRTDPNGPLGEDEIIVSMDRYCAFGYHELLGELLDNLNQANPGANAGASAGTNPGSNS
jgi:hypothetical protein